MKRLVVNLEARIKAAVNVLRKKERRTRLARELAKLDRKAEQRIAEEGLGAASWPLY